VHAVLPADGPSLTPEETEEPHLQDIQIRFSELLGAPMTIPLLRQPESSCPAVVLVGGTVADEEISFLGDAEVVPHGNVGEGEQDQERRMHQERQHPPQREFTDSLRMTDSRVDAAIQGVFRLRPDGLLPCVPDAAEHEVGRWDGDEGRDAR